ncbi:hypothetical protein PHEL85_0766 [Polaribacter sp. Hel1_85]|nr:hypothetical protein PHEL85_0766 [Polaribacter sp. Hel1_85]
MSLLIEFLQDSKTTYSIFIKKIYLLNEYYYVIITLNVRQK